MDLQATGRGGLKVSQAARACDHPDCSLPAVRRCYFCENVCCEQHVNVQNGAMCFACAHKEQEKRAERERAAAEAQAKASGCLISLLLPVSFVLLNRLRLGRNFRRPEPQ